MKQLLAVAVLVLLLGQAASEAQQVEVEFLRRASHIVVPQTRSFRWRRTAQPIRIERVRAHVKILEQAATTTLDVSVRNPGRRQAEAVLLLPVPDGAAVHSFDFQGTAREPTARLLPKHEARRIYDSIVRKVRDPALLEFAGFNLVRTSVFPVPPGGIQRVRLTYNHILHADGNRVDYVLPRSESLDVSVPWEVVVDIKARSPIATVYSPSHELATKRHEPRHLTVRVQESGRMSPGPFRLSHLVKRDGVAASLFAYPDPKVGGGYFLLLAGLPPDVKASQTVKREVTLVIDRSGSMAGGNMDQARAAALQVIEGLADGEAFNIIDYSNAVALFAAKPVIKSAESVKRARAYLAALRPIGGTNIHDALVEALKQDPIAGMLPLVLFLTDGLPTIGRTAEVDIRGVVEKANPHKRRVFTFGVGHDVNVPLLDRIAELTRATTTYVSPEEDVEVKVAQVFKRLYGPVLSDVTLTTLDASGQRTTAAVRELIPAELPDLFDGDQLVLLGQYRGSQPLKFQLDGNYLGKKRSFAFEFGLGAATTRNMFVPRLWASRRIAFLVDQIRQAGAHERGPRVARPAAFSDPRLRELTDEILRLSTEFGILSEYTAFLATEGTNLGDWNRLFTICGSNIDRNAVKVRWGEHAVAQGRNMDEGKKQKRLKYDNDYLDAKLRRVKISSVQQVADRGLFKRGNQWIDGNIVAGRKAIKPDLVVRYGTKEFTALLDALIREGRQGLIARKGNTLIQYKGRNVQVEINFPEEK